ncbi:MAG: acetyl-CoA carboxylase biotin carboxyl carrier protein subunit [Clostridia bacterium]|nr:acetyl-CoA carboxylase biotin carboxyl carrier protein subunit [Clostridia bacterium]
MAGYKIKINGKEYFVGVTETTFGTQPVPVVPILTSKAPEQTKPEAPKAVGSGTPMTAPMPGTVLKIKANGRAVKKGEAVLVLEAMKMENEIAAPADGMVSVCVAEGAKVNSGDILAVIN